VSDPGRSARLLDEVSLLVRRAGEAILATVRDVGEVERKEDGSPVTRADRAAEEILVTGLRALEPGLVVVSEEGDVEGSAREAAATYWLVDPLDGTKEFIKGRPEYTVNVALVEDGAPILGVVQIPAGDCLYVAARHMGARRIDARGKARLRATPVDRPRRAVISRSHLNPATEQYLGRLGIVETTPCGSSLKLCAVAEGRADVYPRFGPTCLWDTAAGAAVALEAGCAVVDLQGRPLRYDVAAGLKHEGFLVCAPGGVLAACLEALRA
jgi:3'(2'), 5'-bisphosphate nucleotidase